MEEWEICEQGWRKGPWTPQEDKLLVQYVTQNGEGRWSSVSKSTGLKRSGKSCRLRWVNYLRPGLKKGQLTPQEQGIIIELHSIWGNKWSTIARYLPGRTDNEIKNYWRTHFKKRSSPISKPCSHKMIKKRRTQLIEEKQETANYEESNVDIESPDQSAAAENGNYKHETGFDCQRVAGEKIDNNDRMLPTMFCQDYHNSLSCSDHFMMSGTIPMDYCYLWDGLWNFDDDRTN